MLRLRSESWSGGVARGAEGGARPLWLMCVVGLLLVVGLVARGYAEEAGDAGTARDATYAAAEAATDAGPADDARNGDSAGSSADYGTATPGRAPDAAAGSDANADAYDTAGEAMPDYGAAEGSAAAQPPSQEPPPRPEAQDAGMPGGDAVEDAPPAPTSLVEDEDELHIPGEEVFVLLLVLSFIGAVVIRLRDRGGASRGDAKGATPAAAAATGGASSAGAAEATGEANVNTPAGAEARLAVPGHAAASDDDAAAGASADAKDSPPDPEDPPEDSWLSALL